MNLATIVAVMPRLTAPEVEAFIVPLEAAMVEAEINTPARKAAFLAQLAHESGELRYFEELASGAAYEGRKDLGNVHPHDGVRYKGRGPIQLTGRDNYRAAGKALGLDLENHPELVATAAVGFRVAGWFWKSHGLNELADAGRFKAITKIINGGLNGEVERERYYARAIIALNASSAEFLHSAYEVHDTTKANS